MTQFSGTKGLSHLFKAADAELAFEKRSLVYLGKANLNELPLF